MKFSTKKMGVNFFPAKKTKPGGGVRGKFGKRPYFCCIFFCAPFPNELCSGQDFLRSQMKKVKVCGYNSIYGAAARDLLDGLPWFPLPAAAGPICR